jgi:WD40 repeat protein
MTEPKRYWAFISYSHTDRAWADWLHRALERYRLPRRLIRGRHRIDGVPPRLAPVFLDRMDLGATTDIDASITEALSDSQSLIVICSPAATRSTRVAQEIDLFRSLNHGPVLPLIVAGRPNAADRGVDPSEECFPVQLRQARPADERRSAVPLAADARQGKGGRHEALLKLIAGIVDANLDQLRQRDLQRRWARWAVSFISLFGATMCALGLALYAWNERNAALASQSRLLTQTAVLRLRDFDVAGAQAIILEVLTNPRFARGRTPAAIGVYQHARAADAEVAVLFGHRETVTTAAYSPDGTRIVTASYDKTARIWDARTGAPLAVLSGHADAVHSAAYSPDGSRIVTASFDKTARIWDARSGAPLAVLSGHGNNVNSAAYSPDGSRIITASFDKTVRIWDARSGAQLAVLFGHGDIASSAAYSPDGSRIVTASADNTARIWDAHSGAQLRLLSGHGDNVRSAAYSPDGSRIVTASDDKTARIWDARTGAPLAVLSNHGSAVRSAAYSPDGSRIVTASADNTARIWDAQTGTRLAVLSNHGSPVRSAAYSPDGTRIVTASENPTARIWAARNGRQLAVLYGHASAVRSAAYSPDGTRIVTASFDRTARIWDSHSGTQLAALYSPDGAVSFAAYSPDGTRIVTASTDKTARIRDSHSGMQLAVLSGHSDFVDSAEYSPDGSRIVTASNDETARIWDARSGAQLRLLSGHGDNVRSAAYSPDGSRIVTASDDKTARVWDAGLGRQLAVLAGHAGAVNFAAYSPDGSRIVTASDDKTARVWDARLAKQLAVLAGHAGAVSFAAYSPDGTRIVTASEDQTARIWDARTGAPLAVLLGHGDLVGSAEYSPDGTRIVTASFDKTVRIWDAQVAAPEIAWDMAAQIDPLSDADRSLLGLAADSRARVWSIPESACDQAAAAFYDPDRLTSGTRQSDINPDIASLACAAEAAKPGHPLRLDYQQARALLATHDLAGARRLFEFAVSRGYRVARIDLGDLMLDATVGMLDPERAASLYENAWRDGVPIAAFALGHLYESGVPGPGVKFQTDLAKAWTWYQKGADVREPTALARFAERDEKSALAERDPSKANALLLQAFTYYAAAAEYARTEAWPDDAWRDWRYRRATLARLLAREGMMQQVADAYRTARDQQPRSSWSDVFKAPFH